MNAFEPRQLLPGASGIPAHMAVANDARVYDCLRDPALSTVIYVPLWSQPVREAFARIAAMPLVNEREFSSSLPLVPSFTSAPGEIEDYARDAVLSWLKPAFKNRPIDECLEILNEVSTAQRDFALAGSRLLQHNPVLKPAMTANLQNWSAEKAERLRVNPEHPESVVAHIDHGDTGLFAYPIGTVLADQTGMDLKSMAKTDCHGMSNVSLAHFANRLWQIPQGAFSLWRGGDHPNAQYHLIPQIPANTQRFRVFLRA